MSLLDPIALLRNAISSGDFFFFLGSGASMEAGLPSWRTAIEELGEALLPRAKNIGEAIKEEAEKGRLLEAAELFYLADITHEERSKCLTDVFGKKLAITPRIINLVKTPCKGFITTNFDRVIIEAASKSSLDLQSFGESPADLANARLCRSQFIVRLHGRIEVPETITLSKSQFARLPSNETYPIFVQSLLSDATIVFFGFSFQDPYFAAVLEIFANATRGRARNQCFALLVGPIDQRIKELLDKLNILVVQYNSKNNHEEGWNLFSGGCATRIPKNENYSEDRLRRHLAAGIAHLKLTHTTLIRQEILQAIVLSELREIIPETGIIQDNAISKVGASLGLPPHYDSLIKSCLFDLFQNELIRIEHGVIFKGFSPTIEEKGNEFDQLVDSILARNSTRYGIQTASPDEIRPALREFLVRIMTADGLTLAHSLISTGQCGFNRINAIIDSTLNEISDSLRTPLARLKPGILSLLDRPQPDEQIILDKLASTTFVICTTLVEPSIISNAERFRESQVFLDTNLVLPWLCEGHPNKGLYGAIIDALFSHAKFPAFYLNELVSHRFLATREFEEVGYNNEGRFLSAVKFAGIQNLNTYIGGYAGAKGNGFSGSFASYLREFAPFTNESEAREFVEKRGISVFNDREQQFYENANVDLIERDIIFELSKLNRSKETVTIKHDAKMIAILKDSIGVGSPRRDYFVTADKTLYGLVLSSSLNNQCAPSFVMPYQAIGLAQLISSNRETAKGISKVLWGIHRTGIERIREYYIDRVLAEYEPSLLSELPKLVEKMITEVKYHERIFDDIYESDAGGNVGKAIVALDQFEPEFHKLMEEARKKAESNERIVDHKSNSPNERKSSKQKGKSKRKKR